MSYQSQRPETARERPALGSRDNYWGGVEEPTAEAYDVEDAEPEPTHAGVSRDRWIAGSILRGAPETSLLCPECWTELTDPKHYVERSEVELEDEDGEIVETIPEVRYTDHRRHRSCPSCGEIAWGGVLADVETSVYLSIVDRILHALDDLPPSTVRRLRAAAADRKSEGLSDEANLERLLIDLRTGLTDN